jgi:GT2 family glycosyltransferase
MISVLIPVYNRIALLNEILESYREQTFTDFEIVIAHEHQENLNMAINSNGLNIREIITYTDGPRSTLPWRCMCYAMNRLAAAARSDYFIITGPEIFLDNLRQIEYYNNVFKESTKSMIICPGKYYYFGHDNDQSPAILKMPLNTKLPFFMGIHRRDYEAIGGMDENYCLGVAYDDDDFVYRMQRAGVTYWNIPECHITHRPHRSIYSEGPEVKKLWERNKKYFESVKA